MSQKANNLIIRLKEELSIKKDKDLCQLLDIKHNTLSTWKKRDTVDFNKILALCEANNLDLNYIFFEEEEDDEAQKVEKKKKPPLKDSTPAPLPSVNFLMSSKLATTKRNIAIFYSKMLRNGSIKEEEIIIGQQISLKKITENTLYIIQTTSNKTYLDKLVFVLNKNEDEKYYRLKDNDKAIRIQNINNIWQVLDKSDGVFDHLAKIRKP